MFLFFAKALVRIECPFGDFYTKIVPISEIFVVFALSSLTETAISYVFCVFIKP